MMKRIKLIIFDLDGTLVDAYPAIIKSFNYTMRKMRYSPSAASVIRASVGRGDANLLKPFVRKNDLAAALAVYRRHHARALLQGAGLFPGARNLLVRLKSKGYLLAVASNRPARFSQILVRHLKIEKYFSCILCADKLRRGKPHPEILSRIRSIFSASTDETLYVGDMDIDAEAGRRAKIRTVIVTTGSSGKYEIQKERPYRIIRAIQELSSLLKLNRPPLA